MERLVAKANILFFNRQYEPGDELPRFDAAMEKAWIESGTAVIKTDVPEKKSGKDEIKKPTSRKKKT